MITTIYRAIINKGYIECLTEQEALKYSSNVDTLEKDIPTQEELDAKDLQERLIIEARRLLEQSDLVAIRCIKDDVKFNSDWKKYVKDLRDVVNGKSSIIPDMPEYPV